MGRYGRYSANGGNSMIDVGLARMNASVYQPITENGWGHTLNVWGGYYPGFAVPTFKLAIWGVNASLVPSDRLAYHNGISANTLMDYGRAGAPLSVPVQNVNPAFSPSTNAVKLVKGKRYSGGLTATGGSGGEVAADTAAIVTADVESLFRKGSATTPLNPFAHDTVAANVGHMIWWIDYEANRLPTTTATGPSGTVVSALPVFTGTFADLDAVYGDRMSKYQIEVTRVSDGVVMWSQEVTASSAQQTAKAFEHTYEGSALAAGVGYRWRVRVADDFNEWSLWTGYTTFTVDDGSMSVAAGFAPYEAYDGFSRVSTTSWENADTGQTWTYYGAAGALSTNGGGGQLYVPSNGGNRTVALESLPNDIEREVLLRFSVPSATGLNFGPVLNYVRSANQDNGYQLRITQNDIALVAIANGSSFVVGNELISPIDANTQYWVRFRYDNSAGRYRGKIWAQGTAEPAQWLLNASPSSGFHPVSTGKVAIRAVATASTFAPTFSAFHVYSLNPDTEPNLPVLDSFERTRGEGFGASNSKHPWLLQQAITPQLLGADFNSVQGTGSVSAGAGHMASALTGSQVGMIGPNANDTDVYTVFSMTGGGATLRFGGRGDVTVGTGGNSSQRRGYFLSLTNASNVATLYKQATYGGTLETIATATIPFTIASDIKYHARLRMVGTSLRVRVWQDGTSEPATWLIDVADSSLTSGRTIFTYWFQSTSPTRAYAIHDLAVTQVSSGDTLIVSTPPTIGSITDSGATLSYALSGDTNANASISTMYRAQGSSTWIPLPLTTPYTGTSYSGVHTITGLSPDTAYEAFVSFVDLDGVTGQSSYLIPFTTTKRGTRYVSLEATPAAESIFVRLIGDWDTDNDATARVRYRLAEAGSAWSSYQTMTRYSPTSPTFVHTIAGLPLDTEYTLEAQFVDADGVYGTPPVAGATTLGRSIHLLQMDITPTETTALVVIHYQYDSNDDATVSLQYRGSQDSLFTTVNASSVTYDRTNNFVYATLSGLRPEMTYELRAIPTDPDGISSGAPTVLLDSFNTLGTVFDADDRGKFHMYRVYSPEGEYLGAWRNAPDPQFTWNENGGVNDLGVTLPMRFSQVNTDRTIEHNNRVDVWVIDGNSKGMGHNLMVDPNGSDNSWTMTTGWTVGETTGADGGPSLFFSSTSNTMRRIQSEVIGLDRVVPVSLSATARARGGKLRMDIAAYDAAHTLLDVSDENAETVGTEWQQIEVQYLPPEGTAYLRVRIENDGAGHMAIGRISLLVREMLIYRGAIDSVTVEVGSEGETVSVDVLGNPSYLSDDYIEFLQYVDIQPQQDLDDLLMDQRRDPADPSVMMRQVIDMAQAQNPACPLYYTEESIKPTGTIASYTFRDRMLRDCFDKIRTFCPPGWHYFIDPDGCVWLRGPEHVTIHYLRLNVEVSHYKSENTARNLKNVVIFKGRQDADKSEPDGYGSINYLAQDPASIQKYGRRVVKISDAQVTTPEMAETIAEGRLEEYNIVEKSGTVTIPDEKDMRTHLGSLVGYNIQSIRPGDRIHISDTEFGPHTAFWDQATWDVDEWDTDTNRILNETVPVKQVSYKGTSATLTLAHLPPTTRGDYARMLAVARRSDVLA